MNDKIPAISVIVPLYNAEKYIAQCLGSILNQTFQDFEVIVVDDCSTDNSVAIVESMTTKFGGKLRLIKCRKNSGGAAIPRNIGIRMSRGKYILFIDNDDMIVSNALEILYDIAEKTQADVLHAEKWFEPQNINEEIDHNTKFIIKTLERGNFVDKITVETEDIAERINLYCQERVHWHVWCKFFRRDFLAENYIEFPNIKVADDMFFTFFCLCLAKKYVRIPNSFNIYRVRKDSFFHKEFSETSLEKYMHLWLKVIIDGTKIISDFMDTLEFFPTINEARYNTINFFVQLHLNYMNKFYLQIPPSEIDLILRKEFSNSSFDNPELMSCLFNIANIYRLNFGQVQNKNLFLQKKLDDLLKTKK